MVEKSLKKNAFYSVLKVFVTLLFPLITFPYASRILLPEGIGKINFVNSIITYFIMLASLGIGGYATREAAKIRDDKLALTKLFKEIITINFICCIIAYVLFFISLFCIPKFNDYKSLLLVCSIKILFSVLGIEWIFTANEDFKYITIRSFIIQFISLIYLFTFVKTKDDIIHYAIFGILTAVGCNIFNFFVVTKYIDIKYNPKLELLKHVKGTFIFFGMSVVTSIYTMLDTSMLGFFSNNIEVGYYSASTKLGHMVLSILTAITAVLLPRLTKYAKENNENSFQDLINKSSNILLLLSFPMTTGLIMLSKPLIILLSGEQYLPAIPSMIVISPILISISLSSLVGSQIIPSIGKEKISFYSYLVGAVTNITLNILLIPKFGSLGAAIGTLGAETTVTFVQIFSVRKLLLNKQFFITLSESFIASFIIAIIINILLKLLISPIIEIIISVLCSVVVYIILMYLFRNKYFIYYSKKIITKVFIANTKNMLK